MDFKDRAGLMIMLKYVAKLPDTNSDVVNCAPQLTLRSGTQELMLLAQLKAAVASMPQQHCAQ